MAMVHAMQSSFRCNPADIEVVIFPCIRKCHYDTSQSRTWLNIQKDVFRVYGEENAFFADGHCDLPGLIAWQLRESGIPEGNIHDVGLCTVCHRDRFFSHVGAGNADAQAVEGRFGAVVGMRG
jgi:copper oxidase (laccase) domain-containing protein